MGRKNRNLKNKLTILVVLAPGNDIPQSNCFVRVVMIKELATVLQKKNYFYY